MHIPTSSSSAVTGSNSVGGGAHDAPPPQALVVARYSWVVWGMLPLVGGGFALALATALRFHFEAATATHCRVRNWLPSFSAVVGGHYVESALWRAGVALVIAQRLADALVYTRWHTRTLCPAPGSALRVLVRAHGWLLFAENCTLLLLTLVSSRDDGDAHAAAFAVFVLCAQSNMALGLWLLRQRPAATPAALALLPAPVTPRREASARAKAWLLAAHTALLLAACYFYWRHNARCEAGVYSLFALCEYLVVAANTAYRLTGAADFERLTLTLAPPAHSDTAAATTAGLQGSLPLDGL